VRKAECFTSCDQLGCQNSKGEDLLPTLQRYLLAKEEIFRYRWRLLWDYLSTFAYDGKLIDIQTYPDLKPFFKRV
jgi:hypothetical protein